MNTSVQGSVHKRQLTSFAYAVHMLQSKNVPYWPKNISKEEKKRQKIVSLLFNSEKSRRLHHPEQRS